MQTLTLDGQVNGIASPTCNMAGQPACTSFQYSDGTFFPINGMGWADHRDRPADRHPQSTASPQRPANAVRILGNGDARVLSVTTTCGSSSTSSSPSTFGGSHQKAQGSVTLDASSGKGYVCDYVVPGKGNFNNTGLSAACDSTTQTGGHLVDLGLKVGSVYEIVVFQAERFTTESHYQLTISGFKGIKSTCTGDCGDKVVTAPEKCDLGAAMNTGAYGGCNMDCTLAPFCGDGTVNGPEECEPKQAGCGADCKKIIVN